MGTKEPHRGAGGDIPEFARRFITARLAGFEKDMGICLTGVPSKARAGETHAYFPAMMSCFGMLEYLAGLFAGSLDNTGKRELIAYSARFMPQYYDKETIRILYDAFRNAVAHRGIASGVWVDPHHGRKSQRLTWTVYETDSTPSIDVRDEPGELCSDPPWRCHYTHRVHIFLGSMWREVSASGNAFADAIAIDKKLQENFWACMKALYPA